MAASKRAEDTYPELFPKDYGERLQQFVDLAGLSWEEFVQRLGVRDERVAEWREGAIPTGGEVWHIMRLASSIPGGVDVMLAETVEGSE